MHPLWSKAPFERGGGDAHQCRHADAYTCMCERRHLRRQRARAVSSTSSIGQCLLGRRNCARTLLSQLSSSTRTRKRVDVSTLMHVAVRFSPTTLPNRAAKRDAATQPGALEQPAFGSTSSAHLVRQLYQIVLPNAVAATPY